MDNISMDNFFETRLAGELNKLRADGMLTDFAICIDEELIKVHKIVLAANSDYFKAMLTSESSEEIKNGQVTLKDVDATTVKLLVNFWYTGKMKLEIESICSLLLTASRFQSRAALEVGTEFARANLTAANCLSIAITCERCNLVDLFQEALALCLEHFEEIIQDAEILRIDEDLLLKIISDDKLKVATEMHVFEFIIRWIEFDEKSRSGSLDKLMSQVRYTSIDPVDLFKPSITNLVNSSAKYRASFEKAKTISLLKDHPGQLQQYAGTFKSSSRRWYAKRRLYVIGGVTNPERTSGYADLNEIYDPSVDQWSEIGYSPAIARDLGYSISGNAIQASDQSQTSLGYNLTKYESSAEYKTIGRFILTRDKCLYSFGAGPRFSSVIKYDCSKKKGTWLAPIRGSRVSPSFVVLDQNFYVMGGAQSDQNRAIRSVQKYDPQDDEWEFVASMHKRRTSFGSCSYQGKIYVAGGSHCGQVMNDAEVYDPKLDTWTEIRPMNCCRTEFELVELSGKIYAVGGFDGDGPTNLVEAYDPDSDTWVEKGKMSHKRRGHCVLAV